MIENSDTFDWYEFYEMGCLLLEKGDEKSLTIMNPKKEME